MKTKGSAFVQRQTLMLESLTEQLRKARLTNDFESAFSIHHNYAVVTDKVAKQCRVRPQLACEEFKKSQVRFQEEKRKFNLTCTCFPPRSATPPGLPSTISRERKPQLEHIPTRLGKYPTAEAVLKKRKKRLKKLKKK